MTKNSKFLGPLIDKNGPKTLQGKANKMLTTDGRRNFDNLSEEEKKDCVFGSGSLVKKKNKKKQ